MSTLTTLRLPDGLLGAETAPVRHRVDARWLMAYAAGLGETDRRFYDTGSPAGPVVHPLFPVCYEWPALVTLREHVIGDELAPRSVHATHELVVTRMPRASETVTTTARVVAIERRRSGALVMARLTTVDDEGCALTTTDYGSVYRGVEPAETGRLAEALRPAAGGDAWWGDERERPAHDHSQEISWSDVVDVSAGAAHVYTECARIWNPIHTDAAVARAAGLPAIILHGTATLAFAVSRVVARELDGDPGRVRGLRARFTGFVRLPSRITVRCGSRAGAAMAFDAVDADGASVLGAGVLSA